MRRMCLLIALVACAVTCAHGYGVAVVNAKTRACLRLVASAVDVKVENQVAIITTTQVFRNDFARDTAFTYAFPMPEGASATALRWIVDGLTWDAAFAPTPQDTTLPGTGPGEARHADLTAYLGSTPLYFPFAQKMKAGDSISVALTYAELLPYEGGAVEFRYPSDYRKIQVADVDTQTFAFRLVSPRTIESIGIESIHPVEEVDYHPNEATAWCAAYGQPAAAPFVARYRLSLSELGLFGFSTMIADSSLPDTLGGFFLFVAEPDPHESADAIDKVFTLVVDRSGSMAGSKMVQARAAARYVVENLNAGDRFNIVDFATDVKSFRPAHVEVTADNKVAAFAYIDAMFASGLTNISGAFGTAVPQFAAASDTTANIIIFLTDGQATTGTTVTSTLAAYVKNLVDQTETGISVFTFGIGGDVNRQLLTILASQNGGLAEFLENDELEGRITAFYQTIRNPVLLETRMTFDAPGIAETYPDPLPSLYRGQQMIVTGRYRTSGATNIALAGTAFGRPVEYEYGLALIDSAASRYPFLPRIWAKRKIEHLLVDYNLSAANSAEANRIRAEIVALSVAWGVISPFTSFEAPTTQTVPAAIEEEADFTAETAGRARFELLGNAPNPFNPSTVIRLRVNVAFAGIVPARIYNALGQVVATLSLRVQGPGYYEIVWDGRTADGRPAASGVYIYVLDFGDHVLAGRMEIVR